MKSKEKLLAENESAGSFAYSEKEFLEVLIDIRDLMKHKKSINHKVEGCDVCKQYYDGLIKDANQIEDEKIKENLIGLFETLWINNCMDLDIIGEEFEIELIIKLVKERNELKALLKVCQENLIK